MDRAEDIIWRAETAGLKKEQEDARAGFTGAALHVGRLGKVIVDLKAAVRALCSEAAYAEALRRPAVRADHYCFASTIGEIAVLVEYASHPSVDLHAIWVNGRSCVDLAASFGAQQLNRWLDEARRHDYRLLRGLPDAVEPSRVEPTSDDAAAAEDRFIAERDAASYQRAA